MILKMKRLSPYIALPVRAYPTDSGFDVYTEKKLELWTLRPLMIPLQIAVELEPGYELQIRPRSSLSKRGVLCHFGTVDEGYRGELAVILHNVTADHCSIRAGERIAQLVVAARTNVDLVEVEELSESPRGANGFGSTGA